MNALKVSISTLKQSWRNNA